MRAVRSALRALLPVLGTGYVLYFFSERVFWSFLHPDDDAFAIIGGWVVYCLFGYLLLSAMRLLGAASAYGAVMAGAFFGWLLEGLYAMTLYGDPSMQFPLTVVWTGLAWHQLLSVGVGLFGMRFCLQSRRPWPSLALACAIGAFWGFWASGWSRETPPVVASAAAFFLHALVASAGLAVAQLAIGAGDAQGFKVSRVALAVVAGMALLFFAAITVPAIPWSPAILVPLLALSAFGMRQSARVAGAQGLLIRLAAPLRPANLGSLVAIPVIATPLYLWLSRSPMHLPAHQAVAAVTGIASSAVFVFAAFKLAFLRARNPQGR